jgi:hypothetical protein
VFAVLQEQPVTANDLIKRTEFRNCPIVDESDEMGCNSLLRPNDPRYEGAISEAEDDVDFWSLLRDPQFVVKGAIRYSESDVRAVFWRKRQ